MADENKDTDPKTTNETPNNEKENSIKPTSAHITLNDTRKAKTPSKSPKNNNDEKPSPIKSPNIKAKLNNPNGFPIDFDWNKFEELTIIKEENNKFKNEIITKNKEILKLEDALTTLHDELTFLESQKVQSIAKDLAKKNRQLVIQLERERLKNANYSKEIKSLSKTIKTYQHHHLSPKKIIESFDSGKITPKNINNNDNNNNNNNANNNNDKKEINVLTQKLFDTKNELKKYKDLLIKTELLLKKEIGSTEINIHEMSREDSSWKGRSEKIALLKTKITQLKKENNELKGISTQEDNNIANITYVASQRAKEYENAINEINMLNDIISNMREVIKGKNSRIKVLETNNSNSRKKLQFFIKKSDNDDELIEKMQKQIESRNIIERKLKKNEKELLELKLKYTEIDTINDKYKNELIQFKNNEIKLKDEINKYKKIRMDTFTQLFDRLNNDSKQYQIEILKQENEKKDEIINTYKKNIELIENKLSRKSTPLNVKPNWGRMKSNELKIKLDNITQEQQLIKASYISIIEGKDREIEIAQKLLNDRQKMYKRYFDDLNEQIKNLKEQL